MALTCLRLQAMELSSCASRPPRQRTAPEQLSLHTPQTWTLWGVADRLVRAATALSCMVHAAVWRERMQHVPQSREHACPMKPPRGKSHPGDGEQLASWAQHGPRSLTCNPATRTRAWMLICPLRAADLAQASLWWSSPWARWTPWWSWPTRSCARGASPWTGSCPCTAASPTPGAQLQHAGLHAAQARARLAKLSELCMHGVWHVSGRSCAGWQRQLLYQTSASAGGAQANAQLHGGTLHGLC